MKERIQRFMAGRYGYDDLNKIIFILECITFAISLFVRNRIPYIILWILIILYIYRAFSKNYVARSLENQKYKKITARFRHGWKIIGLNHKDKTNKYFICPKCAQIVRIPRGRGEVEITCPSCRVKFSKKS